VEENRTTNSEKTGIPFPVGPVGRIGRYLNQGKYA